MNLKLKIFLAVLLALLADWFLGDRILQSVAWLSAKFGLSIVALFVVSWIFLTLMEKGAAKIVFRFKKRERPTVEVDSLLFQDRPIVDVKDDEFTRKKFVQNISKILLSSDKNDGMIIGVYGPWGYGKSSFAKLLAAELKRASTPEPLIVEFDPWLISDSDEVVSLFIENLSTELSEDLDWAPRIRLSRDLVKLGELLRIAERLGDDSPFRAFSEIAGLRFGNQHVNSRYGQLQLQKEKISRQISEVGKDIYIFLDDLDRLQASQILSILNICKNLAAFSNTTYILFYDRSYLEHVLDKAGVWNALEYLEKIIPLEIPLPSADLADFDKFVERRIQRLFDFFGDYLSSSDTEVWENLVSSTSFFGHFKSPRQLKRVLNRTLVAYSALPQELMIADIVVTETLRTIYPWFESVLLEHTSSLVPGLSTAHVKYAMLHEDNEKPSLLEAEFEKLSSNESSRFLELLNFVFPASRLSEKGLNIAVRGSEHRRIASVPGILKYMSLSDSKLTHSNVTAREFIYSPESRENILEELIDSGRIYGFFSYCAEVLDQTPPNSKDLMALAANSALELWRDQRVSMVSEVANFLRAILVTENDPQKREKHFAYVVTDANPISVSERVLLTELQEVNAWTRGGHFQSDLARWTGKSELELSPAFLDNLRQSWLDRCKRELSPTTLTFEEPEPLSILFRMGQLAGQDYSAPKSLVADSIEKLGNKFIERVYPRGVSLQGTQELFDWQSIEQQDEQGELEVSASLKQRLKEVGIAFREIKEVRVILKTLEGTEDGPFQVEIVNAINSAGLIIESYVDQFSGDTYGSKEELISEVGKVVRVNPSIVKIDDQSG